MKKLLLVVLIFMGFLLAADSAIARKAYVFNSTKITLRKGPALGEKILAMLPQDEPVEVLETSKGWSRVRLLRPDRKGREGWVVSGFLVSRVPWKTQAGLLQKENARLKEKLTLIEKEWETLSGKRGQLTAKLEKTTRSLEEVRKRYETLKKEARGFLKLKKEHEAVKKRMETALATTERLTEENMVLKSSQRNTWFLTGAAVLLVGLIFGLIMGRQQKKRRSSYY
ncbi:MAG: TIGR04211 family SH3 domain-containing protein [Deltaproteobacteria bacterium]|nr:TIGR04211 family SH3 domain-containing protein [Deltaproteobacteria bacterium]MBW2049619.1 TIGR04211 family SH3 domain-containing protein [Deltaproteobacteria bacterium]MBW2110209.1 TIGR04211 family SH3 domain-containing protein [Deltaproteobacteria bacterium]MBW2352939.1 TIGR04211 family SH3 domain-containing protein [Deltaproteobacteria bacterium]